MGTGLFCLVVLYHQKISFKWKAEIHGIEKNSQFWNNMVSTQTKQGLLPQRRIEKLPWELDTNSDTS